MSRALDLEQIPLHTHWRPDLKWITTHDYTIVKKGCGRLGCVPWKINMEPENKPSEKERIIFQASLFRDYVKLWGCIEMFFPCFLPFLKMASKKKWCRQQINDDYNWIFRFRTKLLFHGIHLTIMAAMAHMFMFTMVSFPNKAVVRKWSLHVWHAKYPSTTCQKDLFGPLFG